MSQLPADCLNDIFEYLEDNGVTLQSCLLVNRLWCEVSVGIFWRTIRKFSTLITCLPNESKEILYKNEIITSTLMSKSPIFNYVSFCKLIRVSELNCNIKHFFDKQQANSSQSLVDKGNIMSQEIYKLLMNQISSLKELDFYPSLKEDIPFPNFIFTSHPGARTCLRDLSVFHCYSDVHSDILYHLSQICHNIQTLSLQLCNVISNGLTNLISTQQNLKHLSFYRFEPYTNLKDIITSLTNFHNTLIELYIIGRQIPLSFFVNFTNLQRIKLSIFDNESFEDYEELQYITFSQLQFLKFKYGCPQRELLIKFLKNNGNNLKELYVIERSKSFNLSIIKFCPKIKRLYTGLTNYDLETLIMIFNKCKYLESIKIYCEGDLNEKDLFEVVTKYSPRSFYKLKLEYDQYARSKLIPKELESFFVSWTNRVPQQPLYLIVNDLMVTDSSFEKDGENMKIIEKFVKLGILTFRKKYRF
ncbi:hypothetical protein C1645_876130 [Glomus cerebriforme]|uniref:Uncharacterized protein n=1 Tax=Glomus cerebriforme TaxID=658196 RepID=A0A397SWG0_9GLOM|nr:hypothetical protein C1645_876130 [Glomus cerebriforme]